MTAGFDEETAVAEIKSWAKRSEAHTSAEASRAYFRAVVHQMLTNGSMPYSEALRRSAAHHEDIDIALREHVADYVVAGLPVPEELRTYTCQRLFNPPVTYPAGNVPVDDFTRNINIYVLVQLAMERWPHLKRYRNRQAKRVSACSLVAAALNLGEARVEQIVRENLTGKLARKIAS